MSLSTKVCPFCLVAAHTDASACAYCGSSYDRVAPVAASHDEGVHTRLRTYDGVGHLAGEGERVSLYAF
jgi:hypothetical protein